MQKRKVLFVVHQLNYGGVQKALIAALDAVDYKQNEVTLYIRKDRLELLPCVNKKVNKVIVNDDSNHYYRRPYALLLQLAYGICKLFRLKSFTGMVKEKLNQYIINQQMRYEKSRFFRENKRYDVAVAYIQGYTAQFVADYVEADRKIMFFHGSMDEKHELHERIISKFDNVVGVNAGVRNVLCGLYPQYAERMIYLENYVDAQLIQKKCREWEIEEKTDRIMLCSCGRMAPIKGFDLAIEAAKVLKERGNLFIWYFVGDGPERAKLEQMIDEYDLSDYIRIIGMQDNPYPWLYACEIYVQPSYAEAHPLTIVEAKMLCKPVVSTTTVGGRQLVKNGIDGLLAEINGEDLASKIEKLITDIVLRESIGAKLAKIDYSKDYEKYQMGWRQLLEG